MRSVEDLLNDEHLLTVREASAFLRMSASWVYKRVEDGTLPAVVLGNRVRFEKRALQEYVQRCRSGGAVIALSARHGKGAR